MSKFVLGAALLILVSALALPADAAQQQKGGGGKAPQAGGGGGAPRGGGGGGGIHIGGGGGGGGVHISGGGGPRYSSGPRYSNRSISHQNLSRQTFQSSNRNITRSYSSSRTSRSLATQNNPNNLSGSSGRFTSKTSGLTSNTSKTSGLTSNTSGLNTKLNTNTVRNPAKTLAVSKALNSPTVTKTLSNKTALLNPQNRSRILATAATAGRWRGQTGGWWRHRHGGFGWIGPIFWPFAFYDFYDYAWWGDDYYDDYAFWDYGYDDIYAGIFSPYGYDDYMGYAEYLPRRSPRVVGSGAPVTAQPSQLAQMCGDDSSDIAGLPVDRFRQAIQPNAEQQSALDELARASAQAAQDIKNACPAQVGLTAPTRLAAMEQRIQAMIGAVQTVQPPLDKLYGLLSDEQKAQLAALGNGQRERRRGPSLAQSCNAAQSSTNTWPTAELERRLQLTDAQRDGLAGLQDASAKAAEMLKACPPDNALTPPARMAAIETRLETMLQAVKTVHSALDDFYAQLSDEQKARFETLGPQRTRQSADASDDQDQPRVHHVRARRHGYSWMRRFGI